MYSFAAEIDKVRQNKQDGSLQILNTTMEVIKNYLASGTYTEEDLKIQLKNLSMSFPDFAGLKHFIGAINRVDDSKQAISIFISDYSKRWQGVDVKISSNFLEHINLERKGVLLHSNSKTICTLFEEIAKQKLSVKAFQTESLPGGEGVKQAQLIEDLGFQVTVIKDEEVSEQLGKLDILILGADRIEPDVVVNKIGSFMLARIFEAQMKPVYVLADSRKMVESGRPVTGELFERIPRKWLTGIITEKSIFE